MAPVDKTIFCFCHWSGVNEVGADGSVTYVGGTTEQFVVKSGITYEELKNIVFDRLGIESGNKLLHFTVKFNKKQLIRLKDQDGVDHLIQFNDDFAHVYVSNDEADPPATPVVDGMRGTMIVVEPNQIQSEEEHVSGDHSASASVTTSCNDAPLVMSTAWDEALMGEGQAFENADAFRQALFKYSTAKKFPYKFSYNTATYLNVKCAIGGCQWKVIASHEASTNFVSIKKFVDCHSHSPDQTNFKPQFKSKLFRSIIKKEGLECPTLPRELCNDSLKNFSIPLTYLQAWRLKEKVKKETEGQLEDSFKLIPGFCNRLTEAMPGTVAIWSCTEDNIFNRLFIAYECSIRGFHAGCRPLIFIDVRHLSGPSKGSLVVASSLDADNGMYPLAYAVLTSEEEEDWLWFLQHLKLVVQDREVVIVSDRSAVIQPGVEKTFGVDNHSRCYRHVQETFNKFIDTNHGFKLKSQGKETARQYLNDIAYARTIEAYNKALSRMCTFHEELYKWVIASGPEHWSNALFKRPRWDWLNSDLGESFNAWSEEVTLLQIPKMMETHCKRLSEILLYKKAELRKWRLPFGPKIVEKLSENQKVGHDLVVIFHSDFEVELQDQCTGRVVVNLKFGSCACLEWQMTGIPCPHACRAIALTNVDAYECVGGWYKKEVQELIYAEAMCDVSNIEMPCPSAVGSSDLQKTDNSSTSKSEVIFFPRPRTTKRPPGRPRKNPTESESLRVRRPRCTRCNEVGHKRKTCKKPSWIWEPRA
ncbi:hypothetical protein Acr_28g0015000 [Actinidia rufa]|uniref:SWIM-type domain-containing protein n=1 Tax=Actinidia rufa TaxID=165716 RepID=A0A7J0HCT9_9ERIC|nr:hypothetical protein Acr_28g0015000 [Actinidia rufa]